MCSFSSWLPCCGHVRFPGSSTPPILVIRPKPKKLCVVFLQMSDTIVTVGLVRDRLFDALTTCVREVWVSFVSILRLHLLLVVCQLRLSLATDRASRVHEKGLFSLWTYIWWLIQCDRKQMKFRTQGKQGGERVRLGQEMRRQRLMNSLILRKGGKLKHAFLYFLFPSLP